MKKILSIGYKVGMKVLPLCAIAMAVINVNSTSSWLHGQEEVPAALKKYRKF